MLAAERQNEILKQIRLSGIVRTLALAEHLSCAEETVRRDLDKLAEKGLLVRSHGGASSLDERNEDLQHNKREERFVEEKKAIGQLAASLIQANETILLDDSSTCLALVDFLPKELPLNLVTNSLLVAQRVAKHQNHTLIQLGGTFNPVSLSYSGLLTELGISRLTIDRFFFSCRGIDPQKGAGEPSEERARMKQHFITNSQWNCALADHSKILVSAKYIFAPADEIDRLITDRPLTKKDQVLFKKSPIEITTA